MLLPKPSSKEHQFLESPPPYESTCYTLGRIGGHNVVILFCPEQEPALYGSSSFIRLGRDMSRIFPNIRMFLMVEPETDRLYQSHIVHPPENHGLNCALNCGDDPTSLVYRISRSIEYDDTPTIHYGLIVSPSRVMQHTPFSDILAAEHNILCFEMAAAKIAEGLPCLVIHGICDYSDSHSNK
ncbi:hypothetical protein EMCG_09272 [[Emmonsia] crescens]|uniref:Uncharacterized protein n=1 Tax=[Emmonsia] crescens TaxID=73230 RepID=A0A0G2I3N4_9EURO|nr:hypothetical protein EMCG_09272 [Emmonsia crescens UAMH 3008]